MHSKNLNQKQVASPASYRHSAATELIEFFYSVHYEIGTAFEDVVRADVLSRQQAAVLWLIRSQGGDGIRMRRKHIESNVRRWFEVTSAALSRSLRAMMHPPLELIEITEDPRSGREKLVALTPKGIAFLDAATTQAATMLAELLEDVPPDVLGHALTYFRYLTGAFENSQARSRIRLVPFEYRANGEPQNIAAGKTKSKNQKNHYQGQSNGISSDSGWRSRTAERTRARNGRSAR
jgi:DNA-binding MarR family transcriptional regulator